MNQYDFIESHTALDDAIIETYILSKIAARHAIDIGISFFPFRELGETVDFVKRLKIPNREECEKIIKIMEEHLITKEEESAYFNKILNKIVEVQEYMGR